jgi:hypothetical protein
MHMKKYTLNVQKAELKKQFLIIGEGVAELPDYEPDRTVFGMSCT